MKKLVFVFVCVSLFILSSCESKSGHRSATPVTTVKTVKVEAIYTLKDELMRQLDGTKNVQNSMDILAYPWLSNWGAYYTEWGMDKNPGLATPEASIQQYLVSNGKTLKDVFRSLPQDMEWRWMTQNQVVEFCLGHRDFIRNSKDVIVFFCKKDEKKPIYDRNLSEELIAIKILPPSMIREAKIVLNRMDYDNSYASVIVITTKEKIETIEF